MTALTTIAFDGTPIEDPSIGLTLGDTATGLHDMVQRTRPTLVLPLVPGQLSQGVGSTLAQRSIQLSFLEAPTSFTDRQTKLDAIAALFPWGSTVQVTKVDAPGRALTARLQQAPIASKFKTFATAAVDVAATLVADDPYFYVTTAITQSITAGSRGAITMGTAPLHRMLYQIAPCTNPVVILRDQALNELARMTFTGTIPGGKTLDADCSLGPTGHTVILNAGGVDHLDWLGATDDFFLFRLGNGVTGLTLECAQANLSLTYYPGFEN